MTDIEDVLSSLEKQIQDFSFDMEKDTPFVKCTRRTDDDDDDDDVIGTLLQNAQSNEMTPDGHHYTSKSIGLARSLSAGANRFPRKLIPKEPVPAMPPVTKQPMADDDDLQQSLQLAWAVLDTDPDASPSQPTEVPPYPLDPAIEVRGDMIATRIYLRPDGSLHKTVQLSLQFTTAMVLKYLRRKELLDESDDWALFEVDQRLGVERPLRQWESVASILTCWEDRHHVLLVKKYAYAPSLSPDVVTERPLAMHGWLTIEYKKSKWQKRYCYIKDHTVYHARDDTPNASMSVLCYLQAFDVYMVTQDYPTAPSAHVFCLRGQDRPSKYEKPEDYMRYITTDTAGSLDQWVLAIRHAKSLIQYQLQPKRVMYPLGAPKEEASSDRRPPPVANQELLRRKVSTRPGRGNPPAPTPLSPTTPSQPQTLIQLEDRMPFAKGSLLDAAALNNVPAPKLTRSKSAVTRRKPSSTRHDVPLPNTQPIMMQPPTTLLRLETPEQQHTKTLLQRQVKPLLQFDRSYQ